MAEGALVTIAGRSEDRLRQAAAIAAVEGITRAPALDLAPIRVNAAAPGPIDTPLWDSFGAQREAILARGATLPVGRIGRPWASSVPV